LAHVLLTCETWSLTIMMLFNVDPIVAQIIFNIMSCMVEGGRLLYVI